MTLKVSNHWIVGVERKTTKKMGGEMKPVGIVLHYTAGWSTEGDVATLSTSDRQASVQFVVGRDGKLVQIVPCNRIAWHAGPSSYKQFRGLNNGFIGVEISNAGWIKELSNGNFIDQYGQTIRPNGQFVGQSRKTHTPPSDWHHEFHPRLARGEYAWEPFYNEQLDKVEELVSALLKAYPSIKHIVSHEEIDTRGWKTDPGPMFPMRRYTKMLEDRSADVVPPTPTPAPAEQPAPAPIRTADIEIVPARTQPDGPFIVDIKVGYLSVRESPDGFGVARLDAGDRVMVISIDGEWAEVYGVDKPAAGWVIKSALKRQGT